MNFSRPTASVRSPKSTRKSVHAEARRHRPSVYYEPAESTSDFFGGNSNWRGPIWVQMNLLIIEALQRYDYYYGKDFKVECPTGSGKLMTLWEVAGTFAASIAHLFAPRRKARHLRRRAKIPERSPLARLNFILRIFQRRQRRRPRRKSSNGLDRPGSKTSGTERRVAATRLLLDELN